MEQSQDPQVLSVVSKLVKFLVGTKLDLNTHQVRLDRNSFRKSFLEEAHDSKMISIHQELLNRGYVLVSVGTENSVDYFITANTNPLYLKAKTFDSDSILHILSKREIVRKEVGALMAINLSPRILASSICDIAGHSNIGVYINKEGARPKYKCIRCGAVVANPEIILYEGARPKTVPKDYVAGKGLLFNPNYTLDSLDILGVDLDKKSYSATKSDMYLVAVKLRPIYTTDTIALIQCAGINIEKIDSVYKSMDHTGKVIAPPPKRAKAKALEHKPKESKPKESKPKESKPKESKTTETKAKEAKPKSKTPKHPS
ncbi:MAG: hypothetical protein ACRC6V_03985 [Bacteroidales bacterium]